MTVVARAHQNVPCVVMRGGTTRGFFFHAKDVPLDQEKRDAMFLDIVAGHDQRQADGVGASDMLLSKVVTVQKSDRPDADVECTFGAITPGTARVKYGSNCGNLVAAVALFATEEFLPLALNDTVRLFNPQSGGRVDARFMAAEEFREWTERVKTAGMATTGVPVELAFIDPAGTIGRGLLPTGRAIDRLRLKSGMEIDASIVDSGTVYVFVSASDLGLDHVAGKMSTMQQSALLDQVEHLRGQAAVVCGLVERAEDALRLTPAVPKIALISPPRGFTLDNNRVSFDAGEVDMLGRIISSQSFHNSYAVTGALATIAAAVVPGSVVNRTVGDATQKPSLTLRIGHPSGVIELRQDWRLAGGSVTIEQAHVVRTARRLMSGLACVPEFATAIRPSQFRPPLGLADRRLAALPPSHIAFRRRATDALTFPQGNPG